MAASREFLAVPVPLDQYAHAFEDLFRTRIQCQRVRA
jgi:hypothetical protein